MQQDPVEVLGIECHLEYRLGGLKTFMLTFLLVIWKYGLWHQPAETTHSTGQTDTTEAARSCITYARNISYLL